MVFLKLLTHQNIAKGRGLMGNRTECQMCQKIAVVFDGVDEAGHLNYVCEECGEPQED